MRRRSPAESSAAAVADERLVAVREPRPTKASAPARTAAARTSASVASGSPSRMLSATVPRKIVGRCGTHASATARPSSRAVGEVDPADRRCGRPSARRGRAGARRACSCPRRSRRRAATVSPGRDRQLELVEHRALPRRVGERDALEPHRRLSRGLGALRVRARAGAVGVVEQLQDALGDREAVGARVELRAELAQRQVELGREHQHRQPRLQAEPAVVQAHADGDRDEGDAERRRELEHRRRRGSATRSVPIVVAPVALARPPRSPAPAPALRLKARSVGSPRTTSRKCVERSRSACQRSRVRSSVKRPISHMKTGTSGRVSEHHERRGEVDRRDPGEDHHRDDAGEHELGEVARRSTPRAGRHPPRSRRRPPPLSTPSSAAEQFAAAPQRATSAARTGRAVDARRPATSSAQASTARPAKASAKTTSATPTPESDEPAKALRDDGAEQRSPGRARAASPRARRRRRSRARRGPRGHGGRGAGRASARLRRPARPRGDAGTRGRSSPGRGARSA